MFDQSLKKQGMHKAGKSAVILLRRINEKDVYSRLEREPLPQITCT